MECVDKKLCNQTLRKSTRKMLKSFSKLSELKMKSPGDETDMWSVLNSLTKEIHEIHMSSEIKVCVVCFNVANDNAKQNCRMNKHYCHERCKKSMCILCFFSELEKPSAASTIKNIFEQTFSILMDSRFNLLSENNAKPSVENDVKCEECKHSLFVDSIHDKFCYFEVNTLKFTHKECMMKKIILAKDDSEIRNQRGYLILNENYSSKGTTLSTLLPYFLFSIVQNVKEVSMLYNNWEDLKKTINSCFPHFTKDKEDILTILFHSYILQKIRFDYEKIAFSQKPEFRKIDNTLKIQKNLNNYEYISFTLHALNNLSEKSFLKYISDFVMKNWIVEREREREKERGREREREGERGEREKERWGERDREGERL